MGPMVRLPVPWTINIKRKAHRRKFGFFAKVVLPGRAFGRGSNRWGLMYVAHAKQYESREGLLNGSVDHRKSVETQMKIQDKWRTLVYRKLYRMTGDDFLHASLSRIHPRIIAYPFWRLISASPGIIVVGKYVTISADGVESTKIKIIITIIIIYRFV